MTSEDEEGLVVYDEDAVALDVDIDESNEALDELTQSNATIVKTSETGLKSIENVIIKPTSTYVFKCGTSYTNTTNEVVFINVGDNIPS